MDTKSKNIKYSLAVKIVALVILWVSLIVSLASGTFLLWNNEFIGARTYEETYQYKEEINHLIHNTVELGTRFKHGRNVALEPERYKRVKNNLSNAVNFNYYIKNLEREEVTFKIPKDMSPEDFKEKLETIYISKDQVPGGLYYVNDIETMLRQYPQEIYLYVNEHPVIGDIFYDLYTDFTLAKTYMPYAIGGLIGSLFLILASLGYLIVVSGRRERGGEIFLAPIDKIYNDIQSLFVFIVAGLSIALVAGFGFNNINHGLGVFAFLLIFAADIAIGMTYFFSMLRQIKKGVLLKNTLVWKVLEAGIKMVQTLFNQKIFKGWILGILLVYGLVNGILFRLSVNRYGSVNFLILFFLAFNLGALYLAFNRLKSLTTIMEAAKEISSGNLDYQIDQTQISMEFEGFASDIQSIQGGLKNAVSDAIKGEKMKTDLITNVSHDLKTPLTSIINYVDLLKQEELECEKANGYLEILEEKSYRLKQLIEDLIEASKASSGNISITKEAVDLQELILQACGEYEEKIGEAQLDIRISAPEEKVIVLADGKYMWRIIENMMSNALKYSMKNSRVYIDIERREGYGILIMKNMSSYPLDIDPAELTERFTRADESRTTEGSGLGLSIAQSLTSIQDGRFSIEIDGDLFKVIVEIPC